MRSLRSFPAALLILAIAGPIANAQILYNFEPPVFVNGQTTPIGNAPPNVGPPVFLTSFTSTPDANGLQISTFLPNILMSGQILYVPLGAETLTLNFNLPVTNLSVNFAVINPGYLRLTNGPIMVDQPSSAVGGQFQGGTLNYNNPLGFNSVTLAGFTGANVQEEFAIDNLNLAVVPEPTSLTLASVGLLAGWRMIRRNRS